MNIGGYTEVFMKKFMLRVSSLLIIFIFVVINGSTYSQPTKDIGNIYTIWIKLALLGKNQSEIEYYFRNIDNQTMNSIKRRLRFSVLDNLRRIGVKKLISRTSDMDDLNVVVTKIATEIRYAGMEHDEDLRLTIKEEFGIILENL